MAELTFDSDKRRIQQLSINCDWLRNQIDLIHDALCPGQLGTWQDRALQAVAAAEKIAKERDNGAH